MISIRESVFESNSSSCHSISFSRPKSAKYYQSVVLDWEGSEYGWGFASFTDFQSKFSYYLTALPTWLSIMQKKEYAERHGISKEYGQYSFSFETPERIATVRKENDTYGIKYYKEIDSKNIEYIKNLTYDKLTSIYEFLKKAGCIFGHFNLSPNSSGCTVVNEDVFLETLQQLKDSKELDWKNKPDVSDWVYFGGYIDHQSSPAEDPDCFKLASMNPEELLDWIFGDGHFETGNDNC